MGRTYILDANVLIAANREYYQFKMCPGFWELIEKGFLAGVLISHDKVYQELQAGKDQLSMWAAKLPRTCFPKETSAELNHYIKLQNWAKEQGYRQSAIQRFGASDYADPWVCAKAKELGAVLVTNEVSAPYSKKDVKLPDACLALDVNYCNTYQMLAELNAVFLLDPNHSF